MKTVDRVNKIIEGSNKELLERRARSKNIFNMANLEYDEYIKGQAKITGVPRQRIDKLLRDVWSKTCKEQKKLELAKTIRNT